MTDTRTPGESLRVAVHESGHGIMALVLGREVDLLSIRRAKHIDGVAILGATQHCGEALVMGAPAVAQPWHSRREIEATIMVFLAGPAAEVAWVYPDEEGFDPHGSDELMARRLASEVVVQPLSEAQADALAESEQGLGTPDEEQAWMWAERLTPCAESYLNWLRQETRREVRSELFQRRLKALAPALLAAEVLPGETFVEIIQRADRGVVQIAASTR